METSNNNKKVNKKKKQPKNTFKLAECVSMVDVMEANKESVGFLFYFTDKMMEVREREIARC